MKNSALEQVCFTFILCVIVSLGTVKELKAKSIEKWYFDYCDITCNGTEHTMCKFQAGGGPKCNNNLKVYLSKEEKKYIEDILNRVRHIVAIGDDKLPKASNMMKLVWDRELSSMAKRWADQCTQPKHDECRLTMGEVDTGQTVYIGRYSRSSKSTAEKMARIKEALQVWKGEKNLFDTAWLNSYNSSSEETAGNFTQIIWATTAFVGCGYTEFQMKKDVMTRFVCDFKRRGNIPLSHVYREGKPCSKCPARTVCSETYKGMCWNGIFGDYKEDDDAGKHLESSVITLVVACVISLIYI